jgi:hypothetical protein
VVHLLSLLKNSQGWNPGVGWAGLGSESSEKESTSKFIQAVGRIQFIALVRTRSPFPWLTSFSSGQCHKESFAYFKSPAIPYATNWKDIFFYGLIQFRLVPPEWPSIIFLSQKQLIRNLNDILAYKVTYSWDNPRDKTLGTKEVRHLCSTGSSGPRLLDVQDSISPGWTQSPWTRIQHLCTKTEGSRWFLTRF